MPDLDLDELRRLTREATRDWSLHYGTEAGSRYTFITDEDTHDVARVLLPDPWRGAVWEDIGREQERKADIAAMLIVAARNALPTLLDRIDQLRDALTKITNGPQCWGRDEWGHTCDGTTPGCHLVIAAAALERDAP